MPEIGKPEIQRTLAGNHRGRRGGFELAHRVMSAVGFIQVRQRGMRVRRLRELRDCGQQDTLRTLVLTGMGELATECKSGPFVLGRQGDRRLEMLDALRVVAGVRIRTAENPVDFRRARRRCGCRFENWNGTFGVSVAELCDRLLKTLGGGQGAGNKRIASEGALKVADRLVEATAATR